MNEFKSKKNVRLLIAVVIIFFIAYFPGGFVGYSYSYQDGETLVQAGSSPLSLIMGFVAICSFLLLLRMSPSKETDQWSGLTRRFGAFVVDFGLSVITLAGIFGIIAVLVEYVQTGQLSWTFSRDRTVATDTYLFILSLFMVEVPLVLYLAWPVSRRKQTIGCYLMSIKVVSTDSGHVSLKRSVGRVLLGFVSLAAAFLTVPCALHDKQRRMWHDKITGTRVVLVEDQ